MKKMEILTKFFLKIPFVFHGLYVREDLDVHAIVAAHKAIGFKDKSQYEKNCPGLKLCLVLASKCCRPAALGFKVLPKSAQKRRKEPNIQTV